MFLPREKRNRRRAMTLIEIIVASSLAFIVTGIILSIFVETQRNATRGQDKLALENHARQITEEVCAVLRDSVAPSSLDTPGTTLSLTFKSDQCSLISTNNFNGKDLYRTTINTTREPNNGPSRVELNTSALDSSLTPVLREGKRIPVKEKGYSSAITFEYATSLDEAMERKPSYKTELKPGEYPQIIRVHVRVEQLPKDSSEKPKPYEIITAIRTL